MTRQLATAASGALRSSHYVYNPVTALYERSTLVEGTRVNLCTRSEDFSSWDDTDVPVTSNVIVAPDGNVTADKLAYGSGAGFRYKTITFTGNGTKVVFIRMQYGTAASSKFGIFDNTAGAFRALTTVTWTNGVPTLGSTTGTAFAVKPDTLPGWYWLALASTSVTAANDNWFLVYPSAGSVVGAYTYMWGAQAEDAAAPSSYVPTVAATVTRAAESIYAPYTRPPENLTAYVKGIELGTNLVSSASAGLIAIGGSSDAGLFIGNNGSNRYVVTHRRASDVSSTAAAATAYGDLVELRAVLGSDGSVALGQTINNGTEAVASTSAANALASAWVTERLYIGERGGGTPGFFAFFSVKIARGTRTLEEMRALADMATSVLVLNAGDADAITVRCQQAGKAEAEDIGGRTRAFAGNLRVSTRDQKRTWTVTTDLLDQEDALAIETLVADNAPIPCGGMLMGDETVTCSVKVANATLQGPQPWTVLTLMLTEV